MIHSVTAQQGDSVTGPVRSAPDIRVRRLLGQFCLVGWALCTQVRNLVSYLRSLSISPSCAWYVNISLFTHDYLLLRVSEF